MKYSIFLFLLIFMFGCQDIVPTTQISAVEDSGNGKIFIKDRMGKKWNVTHAVKNYGFKAEEFQFGLGQYAIPPLLNPRFLQPGDPDYPGPNLNLPIIGFKYKDEARAYPLSFLVYYEVVDDQFDSTYVAAAF